MPSRALKPGRAARSVESAQFYRLIAETIPHMIWSARADGWLDYFNGRVLEYTGRSPRQLEGWGWRTVIHDADWEHCLQRWTHALRSGRRYEIEYRLRRHDGAYRWHLGAAMPQREGTSVVRWFGTCTDIEEQKKASRLLRSARQTLDALVATRATAASENSGDDPAIERLSARERQVLTLIVDGLTSAEVGEQLGLSPKSVDTYRSRLMAKLELEDLPALVKFAIRHGLTTFE